MKKSFKKQSTSKTKRGCQICKLDHADRIIQYKAKQKKNKV